MRQLIPVLLLLTLNNPAFAVSPFNLEARDLDGDITTIEAYYYLPLDITWLADTNLGQSHTFGLQRGPITDYGSEVNDAGEMLRDALNAYMAGMNQSRFLGHSHWRLPVAQGSYNYGCSAQSDNGAITWGIGCSGPEAGELNHFLTANYSSPENSPFNNLDTNIRWLSSSGPAGRHYYRFGGQGSLQFCGSGRCVAGLV